MATRQSKMAKSVVRDVVRAMERNISVAKAYGKPHDKAEVARVCNAIWRAIIDLGMDKA